MKELKTLEHFKVYGWLLLKSYESSTNSFWRLIQLLTVAVNHWVDTNIFTKKVSKFQPIFRNSLVKYELKVLLNESRPAFQIQFPLNQKLRSSLKLKKSGPEYSKSASVFAFLVFFYIFKPQSKNNYKKYSNICLFIQNPFQDGAQKFFKHVKTHTELRMINPWDLTESKNQMQKKNRNSQACFLKIAVSIQLKATIRIINLVTQIKQFILATPHINYSCTIHATLWNLWSKIYDMTWHGMIYDMI